RPLFSFRVNFEMHPSAFVFGKDLADSIAARCGRFFQTNGVEYSAWPMAAALAKARIHIDVPLIALGRTAKSWGSNLNLTNPGKDRIQAFISHVEKQYGYAPLTNFTTANMWAEGILTAKKLLPRELGIYEFDELAYVRRTARELEYRRSLGVDVSIETAELERYIRQNPALGSAVGTVRRTQRGGWQPLRSLIGNAGARNLRQQIRTKMTAWKLSRGHAGRGFNVPGAAFGFYNVLESAEFLARVSSSITQSS